ncbi:MAG: hypothetical protein ABI162_06790 [Luteolibacter sp.]
MTNKEIIEIVSAAESGEKIEVKWAGHQYWIPLTLDPPWDFRNYEYRVGPKPLLECWVNEWKDGAISGAYRSADVASRLAIGDSDIKRVAVHMREVVE